MENDDPYWQMDVRASVRRIVDPIAREEVRDYRVGRVAITDEAFVALVRGCLRRFPFAIEGHPVLADVRWDDPDMAELLQEVVEGAVRAAVVRHLQATQDEGPAEPSS